jgi:hypothetical protein
MVYVVQVCRQLARRTRMELHQFGKLVHLVGFIIKKFVTMHGHVNLKNCRNVHSCTEVQIIQGCN